MLSVAAFLGVVVVELLPAVGEYSFCEFFVLLLLLQHLGLDGIEFGVFLLEHLLEVFFLLSHHLIQPFNFFLVLLLAADGLVDPGLPI